MPLYGTTEVYVSPFLWWNQYRIVDPYFKIWIQIQALSHKILISFEKSVNNTFLHLEAYPIFLK